MTPTAPTTQRILVVDDDPGIRHLIWLVLRRAGLEVATARNTNEAEERLRNERFALMVTDHDMPRETGLSFVRRMRSTDCPELGANRDMPVVVCSANSEPGYLDEVTAAGVGAFVEKPFRPESFAELVKALMLGHDDNFIHLRTFN